MFPRVPPVTGARTGDPHSHLPCTCTCTLRCRDFLLFHAADPRQAAQPLNPQARPWIDLFLPLPRVGVSSSLYSDSIPIRTPRLRHLDATTQPRGARDAPVLFGASSHSTRNPPHPRPIKNATLDHPYPHRADHTPSIHRHIHTPSHVQSRIVASSHCPRVIASQIPQDTHPPPIRDRRNWSPTIPLGSHQPTTTTTGDITIPTLLPSRLLPCVAVASHPPRRQAKTSA